MPGLACHSSLLSQKPSTYFPLCPYSLLTDACQLLFCRAIAVLQITWQSLVITQPPKGDAASFRCHFSKEAFAD